MEKADKLKAADTAFRKTVDRWIKDKLTGLIVLELNVSQGGITCMRVKEDRLIKN